MWTLPRPRQKLMQLCRQLCLILLEHSHGLPNEIASHNGLVVGTRSNVRLTLLSLQSAACAFRYVPLAPPCLVLNVDYCEVRVVGPCTIPGVDHLPNFRRIVVDPDTVDVCRGAH